MFPFHNISKTLFGASSARRNSPILPPFDIIDGRNTCRDFIVTGAGQRFLSYLIKRAKNKKDPRAPQIHQIVITLSRHGRDLDYLTQDQRNLLFKLINNYNIHICKYNAYVQLTTPQDKARYEHILFKTGYGAKFLKLFAAAYPDLRDKFINANRQVEALTDTDQACLLKSFNWFFRTGCRSVVVPDMAITCPAIAKHFDRAIGKIYSANKPPSKKKAIHPQVARPPAARPKAVSDAGKAAGCKAANFVDMNINAFGTAHLDTDKDRNTRMAARLDEFAKRDEERFNRQAIQIGIRHLVGGSAVVIKETKDKIIVQDKKTKKIYSLDRAQVINIGKVNKTLLESATDGLLAGTEDMGKTISLVYGTAKEAVKEKSALAAFVAAVWNKADNEYRKKYGEEANISETWINAAFKSGKSAPYADTKNYGEGVNVSSALVIGGISAPETDNLFADIKAGAADGAVKLVSGTVDCVTNPPQMAYSLLTLLTPDGRSAFIDELSKTYESGDVTKITSETIVLTFTVAGICHGANSFLTPRVKSLKLKIAKSKVTAVVDGREYANLAVVGKVLKDIDDFKLKPSKIEAERLNLVMKNKAALSQAAQKARKTARAGKPAPSQAAPAGWRVVPARNNALNVLEDFLDLLFRNKNKPAPAPAPSGAPLREFVNRPRQELAAEENYLFAKGRGGKKTAPAAQPQAVEKPAGEVSSNKQRTPKCSKYAKPVETTPNITDHDLSILEKLIDHQDLTLSAIARKYGFKRQTISPVIKKMKSVPKEIIKKRLSERLGREVSIEEIDKILTPRRREVSITSSDLNVLEKLINNKDLTLTEIEKKYTLIQDSAGRVIKKMKSMPKEIVKKRLSERLGRQASIEEIDKILAPRKRGYSHEALYSREAVTSALVSYENQTETAKRLGCSQPTISECVNKLKNELSENPAKQEAFVEKVKKFRKDKGIIDEKEITWEVIKEAFNKATKVGGGRRRPGPSDEAAISAKTKTTRKKYKLPISAPSQAARPSVVSAAQSPVVPPKPPQIQKYIPVSAVDVAEELLKSGRKGGVKDIARKLGANIAEVEEKIVDIQEMSSKKLEKMANTLNTRGAKNTKEGIADAETNKIITPRDILNACPDEATGKSGPLTTLTATPECLAKTDKVDLEFVEMIAETTSKPENLKAISENLKLPDDIREFAAGRLEQLKKSPAAESAPVEEAENITQRVLAKTPNTVSEYLAQETNDPETLRMIIENPSASEKAKKIARNKLDAAVKAEELEENKLAEDMAAKKAKKKEREEKKAAEKLEKEKESKRKELEEKAARKSKTENSDPRLNAAYIEKNKAFNEFLSSDCKNNRIDREANSARRELGRAEKTEKHASALLRKETSAEGIKKARAARNEAVKIRQAAREKLNEILLQKEDSEKRLNDAQREYLDKKKKCEDLKNRKK